MSIPTTTDLYRPLVGWATIESGPADLLEDERACMEAHAARIVSRLGLYTDTTWQAALYTGLWDLPLPGDAPGDDSPETGPTTGDDTAPIPATPAGAMRAAPDAQGVGSSWRAKQAWAQSEARQRGLVHPEVAL